MFPPLATKNFANAAKNAAIQLMLNIGSLTSFRQLSLRLWSSTPRYGMLEAPLIALTASLCLLGPLRQS
jgi:hypothetical protein